MATSDSTTLKQCSKKQQCIHPETQSGWLPTSSNYFHRDKTKRDGLSTTCKACAQVNRRKWYLENREHAIEYSKQWVADHYEETLAYNRVWRRANLARVYGYDRAWKRKHRDVYLKGRRRRYLQDVEARRYEAKRWKQTNPDKARLQWKVRQARKRSAEGKHSSSDITELYETQHGLCAYCGIRLFDEYHVDHMHPLSKGGSNWPENLALACEFCNLSKSDKLLSEWEGLRGW